MSFFSELEQLSDLGRHNDVPQACLNKISRQIEAQGFFIVHQTIPTQLMLLIFCLVIKSEQLADLGRHNDVPQACLNKISRQIEAQGSIIAHQPFQNKSIKELSVRLDYLPSC